MTTEIFQRARRPEQKLQRQDAILGAARDLALRDGVRNVSLADIAARVGIHKSALLRYFETREQIFLELTAEAWRDWARHLHARLDAAPTGSARLVADVFARSFSDRPLLCDLIAHTPLNLERNVSPEAVRRYKRTSLGVVNEAGGQRGGGARPAGTARTHAGRVHGVCRRPGIPGRLTVADR
jgi:AcrR family transcriptional regulator